MFESEREPSQFDDVDFEDIIRAKIIDKSKDKPKGSMLSQDGEGDSVKAEEFSPSWFNAENQRFDVDESDKNSSG
jgi:hypothetical protein